MRTHASKSLIPSIDPVPGLVGSPPTRRIAADAENTCTNLYKALHMGYERLQRIIDFAYPVVASTSVMLP